MCGPTDLKMLWHASYSKKKNMQRALFFVLHDLLVPFVTASGPALDHTVPTLTDGDAASPSQGQGPGHGHETETGIGIGTGTGNGTEIGIGIGIGVEVSGPIQGPGQGQDLGPDTAHEPQMWIIGTSARMQMKRGAFFIIVFA